MYYKTIRILGVPLNRDESILKRLKKIRGLGDYRIKLILSRAQFPSNRILKTLKSKELLRLTSAVEYYQTTQKWLTYIKLNRVISKNIELLKFIKSFRGLRHQMRLPCRGQRTRSNRKTVRFLYNKPL